jgi:hypothetical protein
MSTTEPNSIALEIALQANKNARAVYDDLCKSQYALRLEELTREIDISDQHNWLVHVCGSSFLPRGTLYQETGYQLFCFEPLVELELDETLDHPPKCFDVLLFNEEEASILAVECKISHSQDLHGFESFIKDVWRKADDLLEWMDYLSDQIGFKIAEHEVVLCVKGGQEQRAAKSLQRVEQQSAAAGQEPDHIIKLWYCDLQHNGRLQLHSSMARTNAHWNQHRSSKLNRKLAFEGFPIENNEIGTRLFFKSPTMHLAAEFIGYLVELYGQREDVDPTADDYGRFDTAVITRFYQDHLNHYDAARLAERLTERVLDRLLVCDLVEMKEDGTFTFKQQIRRPRTAIKTVQGAILQQRARELAEETAAQEVIRRFVDTQPLLFDELKQ